MSEIVTQYNETEYRLRFSLETGHSMNCIEATIDEMLYQFATMSYNAGFSEEAGIQMLYDRLPVERFDAALLKLLVVKKCDCGDHRQLN